VTTGDAFGEMLLRGLTDPNAAEIAERDDGFIAVSTFGARVYFAPLRRWPAAERRALRYVRGRVLDVGCGGGRVCLEAQARGLDVVGIDISPGAVEACRRRGVRDVRLLGIDDVDSSLGPFDTIVMFGNNFGLFGRPTRAKRLLRRFAAVTTGRGRIVASSRHVYDTDEPSHLAYQRRNRERGRLSGELRIRMRFRDLIGPWFDYLIVTKEEMADVIAGTGWTIAKVVEPAGEPLYCAVLEKEG
jgi:SAM-dependent methyltransferase